MLSSEEPVPPAQSPAGRRAKLIAIIRRRVRPGTGSIYSVIRALEVPRPMEPLAEYLSGIRFVIVGGIATALYMPTQMTVDLDVLIATTDSPRVEQALRRVGGTLIGSLAIGGTSWVLPGGTALVVLESDEEWVDHALTHPNRDRAGAPIISLPYLVLLKIRASRGQDIGDLTRMLGGADEAALVAVRSVIQQYEPDALEDSQSLIEIGRLEYVEPTLIDPDQKPTG
jgi:hypothetical protein